MFLLFYVCGLVVLSFFSRYLVSTTTTYLPCQNSSSRNYYKKGITQTSKQLAVNLHNTTMTSVEVRATKNENVQVKSQANIPAIFFAISIPTSTPNLGGPDGILGSIILLRNSAVIWVGKGKLDSKPTSSALSECVFGNGAPTMSQLVVAMPRTKYSGSFGTGSKEPSCSHIIGGDSSDDQMLASQMASRLSVKCKMPCYVSCRLSTSNRDSDESDLSAAGQDSATLAHRAAALAEREVWRILKERKSL